MSYRLGQFHIKQTMTCQVSSEKRTSDRNVKNVPDFFAISYVSL